MPGKLYLSLLFRHLETVKYLLYTEWILPMKKPVKTTSKTTSELPLVEFDEDGAVKWPFAAPRHGVRGLRYMTDDSENPLWPDTLARAKTDAVLMAKLVKHGLV